MREISSNAIHVIFLCWIDDYDARDVVYQKVLMTPDPKDKATGQNKPTQKKDTPSATEDTTKATEDITSATEDTTSKRHHPVQAIPNGLISG